MINSMRTEKIQFELWCMQCAANVWRKRALNSFIHHHLSAATDHLSTASMPTAKPLAATLEMVSVVPGVELASPAIRSSHQAEMVSPDMQRRRTLAAVEKLRARSSD